MRSIRHVETAALGGNGMQAFSVCIYTCQWFCPVCSNKQAPFFSKCCRNKPYSRGDLPALWPQLESLPRQRSWSWPQWWTDSLRTQTCRPALVVSSSGILAPESQEIGGYWKRSKRRATVLDWTLYNMSNRKHFCMNHCHSRSQHFSGRFAGCRYLFPAQSCCNNRQNGMITAVYQLQAVQLKFPSHIA